MRFKFTLILLSFFLTTNLLAFDIRNINKSNIVSQASYNVNDTNLVDSENAENILNKAEAIENNSNQLLTYTNVIKKNSMDIKKDIIEHLWKVIISDNSIECLST